jgi:pimeloyl-ACP methyl ester carboxylesterase
LLWAGPAAAEAQYHEGTLDGADYLIGVPSDWNGGLVIYAHGYEGELPGRGNVQVSPLANYVTGKGIAWAATGFRAVSYRPDWFLDDVLTLRAHIARRFGTPRWTVIQGLSMGGHISVAALELHPDKFQGALVECGVVDGVGLVDWLYAYTAAAEYFSGVPLLDTPRPAFNTLVNERLVPALGLPGSYTERGRAFDSVVKHLAGGDVPLRLEGLARRYLLNLNPREPGPQSAREFARHADTRHIRYAIDPGFGVDGETVNHDIRRIEPPPGGALTCRQPRVRRTDRPAAGAPDDDPRKRRLPRAAGDRAELPPQGRGGRPRRPPGAEGRRRRRPLRHARADARAAFDDLLAWMDKGAKPKGDDLLGSVTAFGQW